MVVNNKIKKYRKRLGISIAQLAYISELNRSTIYRIKNNLVHPRIDTIEILLKTMKEIRFKYEKQCKNKKRF